MRGPQWKSLYPSGSLTCLCAELSFYSSPLCVPTPTRRTPHNRGSEVTSTQKLSHASWELAPFPPNLQRPQSSLLKSGRDFISEHCNLLFAFLTAAADCSVSGGQGQHFGYLCVHRAWHDAWHKIGSQNFCPGYVVNMEQCQTFTYEHPASDLTPGGRPLSSPSVCPLPSTDF